MKGDDKLSFLLNNSLENQLTMIIISITKNTFIIISHEEIIYYEKIRNDF